MDEAPAQEAGSVAAAVTAAMGALGGAAAKRVPTLSPAASAGSVVRPQPSSQRRERAKTARQAADALLRAAEAGRAESAAQLAHLEALLQRMNR